MMIAIVMGNPLEKFDAKAFPMQKMKIWIYRVDKKSF